jgi:hypothetical protein
MTSYTFKRKNLYLFFGVIALSILSYNLAIKKTLQLHFRSTELTHLLNSSIEAPDRLSDLRKEDEQLVRLVGNNVNDASKVRLMLLGNCSQLCDSLGCKLLKVDGVHTNAEQEMTINTHIFTLEGSFSQIVLFLRELETTFKEARIVAVHYDSRTDPRIKSVQLEATVYVQHIEIY